MSFNKSFKSSRSARLSFPGDPRIKQVVRVSEKKEKQVTICGLVCKEILKCWKENKRVILMVLAVINLLTAWSGIVWLWYSDESPSPPFLGFSWWGEVRAMLLPECVISCGHCFFLLHGALRRKQVAVLLSALCQAMQTLGAIVFFIFFLFDFIIVDWRVLVMIVCYIAVRCFVLYVTVVYNQQLCVADEASRDEEALRGLRYT